MWGRLSAAVLLCSVPLMAGGQESGGLRQEIENWIARQESQMTGAQLRHGPITVTPDGAGALVEIPDITVIAGRNISDFGSLGFRSEVLENGDIAISQVRLPEEVVMNFADEAVVGTPGAVIRTTIAMTSGPISAVWSGELKTLTALQAEIDEIVITVNETGAPFEYVTLGRLTATQSILPKEDGSFDQASALEVRDLTVRIPETEDSFAADLLSIEAQFEAVDPEAVDAAVALLSELKIESEEERAVSPGIAPDQWKIFSGLLESMPKAARRSDVEILVDGIRQVAPLTVMPGDVATVIERSLTRFTVDFGETRERMTFLYHALGEGMDIAVQGTAFDEMVQPFIGFVPTFSEMTGALENFPIRPVIASFGELAEKRAAGDEAAKMDWSPLHEALRAEESRILVDPIFMAAPLFDLALTADLLIDPATRFGVWGEAEAVLGAIEKAEASIPSLPEQAQAGAFAALVFLKGLGQAQERDGSIDTSTGSPYRSTVKSS